MISFDDFKKTDIRIARIKSVGNHPNADKLYVLKVDIGDEERQLVAGLRGFYTPEQLEGKSVAVIVNLEPAVLRGVESQGMLLAAVDGSNVVILQPEADVAPGAKVM